MNKLVTVGMVGIPKGCFPPGKRIQGASGNQLDSNAPPDTSLTGIREAFHATRPLFQGVSGDGI